MTNTFKIFTRSAVALSVMMLVQSCAMEAPFADGAEGTLNLTTLINNEVKTTRGVSNADLQSLRENCIVYIENNKGVIRKYKGLDNIPDAIKLQSGSYVAEAWSGDSVSASFSSKFYRGYQKFEVAEGNNSLTLHCNIANVVVSVDPSSLDVNLSDMKVTFWHSRGELLFTEENIGSSKGYFMMPNADKDLNYKIEGKKQDNTPFTKEGVISNVQRAHEYSLKVTEDAPTINDGGALIRVVIADIPLYETEVEIFTAPVVRGIGFDLADQVVSLESNFTDTKVYVRGYFGLSSLIMNFSSNFTGLTSGQNILEAAVISNLASKGIVVERSTSKDASTTSDTGEVDVDEVYITFTKAFLDALPKSTSEYTVSFEVTDNRHKTGNGTLRLVNDPEAVEYLDPVVPSDTPDPETDPMAIGARTATLSGVVVDENATDYGIQYRKQGTSQWTKVYPSSSQSAAARRSARRAGSMIRFSVTITNLEPGTTYEYTVFSDGFESSVINTFSTESIFIIPDASFEEWSTYTASTMLGNRTVVLPGNTGDKYTAYWGSGNEGSSMANVTLTNKSTDMVHSGQYSVRLGSASVLGVLAAGNIFVGYFAAIDGTNGVLKLGREYNGSHPTKVRVYANYRPGIVDVMSSGNEGNVDFVKGENDHGQIYIALADEAIDIRTNPENQKLFSTDDPHVLAYGQVTWTDNFGPDGQLQMIEIPFEYFERSKTKRPTHLIITCCASKFGDFFSGSSSSVMYLDDFELVYE